jgi:TolB protein
LEGRRDQVLVSEVTTAFFCASMHRMSVAAFVQPTPPICSNPVCPGMRAIAWYLLLPLCSAAPWAMADDLGLFEAQTEVGAVGLPGAAAFDASSGSYLVTGGGENMWFTNDAFHFVWKKLAGDFALRATIDWPAPGGNAHRKACLIVRQGLEPDSAYVDAVLHGDGLLSLQFRDTPGGLTREIQASPFLASQALGVSAEPGAASAGAGSPRPKSPAEPIRIGIERQGDVFFMTIGPARATASAAFGGRDSPGPAGNFIRLAFTDPVYVGLGVCAHDNRVAEQARFTGISLTQHPAQSQAKPALHCTLETVAIASQDRRAIYHTLDHIEAPNWSPDGKYFLFNSNGRIYRLPAGGGLAERIDTGSCDQCNNDHGLSPDGSTLAISDQSRGGKSLIYTLPASGGIPRRVTTLGPSYWHGWSPDGSRLAYCAERNGEFDIYTIATQDGEETRLTTANGLDDGPDYTADGNYIYFNSERSGTMQVWRMRPDGSQQEQVTSDACNNWFPHPSPDGKWLVFLSYESGVRGHPANQPVRLRLMPLTGGATRDLARLFGGQGTINVPSWSPDSHQLAFVSYELIRP